MATWTVDASIATTVEADTEEEALEAGTIAILRAVVPDEGVYVLWSEQHVAPRLVEGHRVIEGPVYDTCTVHGGPRCEADLKFYGYADHCSYLRDNPGLCRFPNGDGIGDQVEVTCVEEEDDGTT